MAGVRADKFVWCVRLSKTRSDAADLLRSERVLINNMPAKPSREVNIGDVISVKRMPAVFQYKVTDLTQRRVGAKLVADFLVDITPQSELEKLEIAKYSMVGQRDRGAGRPTKRERREIEDFFGE